MKKLRIFFADGGHFIYPANEVTYDDKSVWVRVWKNGEVIETISASAITRIVPFVEELEQLGAAPGKPVPVAPNQNPGGATPGRPVPVVPNQNPIARS